MREGSEVAKGAALFRIDDQELKAQVARAEAERDLAEQALARTKAAGAAGRRVRRRTWSGPKPRRGAAGPVSISSSCGWRAPRCGRRSAGSWGNAS